MKTLKVLLQEVVSGVKAWVNSNFAQESSAVHKTGNETVNGGKTLTGYIMHTLTYDCIQATAFDVRTDPEATRGRDIFRFWEGDSSSLGDYLGGMSYYQETDGSSRLQLICFGYPTSGNATQQRINFHAYRDGIGSFYPVRSNVNLGTSSYKWKTLNGVNPGALSLPDGGVSTSIQIDTTDWDLTGQNQNNVLLNNTPGYLWVSVPNVSGNYIYARRFQAGGNMQDCRLATGDGLTDIFLIFPLTEGNALVKVKSNTVVARFFLCKGNV